MRDFIKHNLDYEKTIPYVKACLKDGNFACAQILNTLDFSLGTFFTYLRPQSDLSLLYQFETGGISPKIDPKSYKPSDFNIDSYLANYLNDRINQSKNNLCVFEDVLSFWDDKHLLPLKNKNLVYKFKNEIYYILDDFNSEIATIKNCINTADALWHFVCFLTSSKDFKKHHDELTSHDLTNLAQSIDALIIGAYDGESYVFWENAAGNKTVSTLGT